MCLLEESVMAANGVWCDEFKRVFMAIYCVFSMWASVLCACAGASLVLFETTNTFSDLLWQIAHRERIKKTLFINNEFRIGKTPSKQLNDNAGAQPKSV